MKKKHTQKRLISGIFLIAGTMTGAGMLGMPLVTATSGFWPGAFVTTLVWFFMYCTALLFLEVTLWMPDGSHVLSICNHFLGKGGALISGGFFAFLYYCLMIAYFAAGAPLLAEFLDALFNHHGFFAGWKMFALFAAVFGSIVAISPKSIDRVNLVLSIAMILAWIVLVGNGGKEVDFTRLQWAYWPAFSFPIPVLFGAFGFHNVIPSLCTYLKRDRKALRLAIFWGSFLPLIVYLIWQWLVIGSIPRSILEKTLLEGGSVTVAFQSIIGSRFFPIVGKYFAFFAIVTSTLGVAFSMVDFLGDGLKIQRRYGVRRVGLTLFTFLPPFILVLLYPNIFTLILGMAGGFGEAFLNGLLPIILLWVGKHTWKRPVDLPWLENKRSLIALSCFAFYVVGLECMHLLF